MISNDDLVSLYQKMVKIRLFEEKMIQLFDKGLVPGNVHLSTGQEAIAVGVCAKLKKMI